SLSWTVTGLLRFARNDAARSEIGWRRPAWFAKLADMNIPAKSRTSPSFPITGRVDAIDWTQIGAGLDTHGCAVIEKLLAPPQCAALAALYPDASRFRSRIVMSRHGFGRGEYKYFSYPLPDIVAELRPALYAPLAPIANRWNA